MVEKFLKNRPSVTQLDEFVTTEFSDSRIYLWRHFVTGLKWRNDKKTVIYLYFYDKIRKRIEIK